MDLTYELETAKTIARMAASICQSIQAELIVAEKSGHEPVTIADYASQALILHALASNFEDDAVLAEEHAEEFELLLSEPQRQLVQRYVEDALGGYVFAEDISAYLDFGRRRTAERLWVVDPIDGTKGFVAERHYCVAISLLIAGEPVLGVLASPGFYSDQADPPADPGALTYALRGGGAYQEALYGGEREPIRVSATHDPQRAVVLASYEGKHTDIDRIRRTEAALGRGPDAPIKRLDSQDKHAMIANGMGDIYLRMVPDPLYQEKLWDHAAGYAIVTEAGGQVTDLLGQPLDFSAGPIFARNRGVLVTNGTLHTRTLDAIRQAMDE
ncbi:inositol monophosphatase family protein [Aggregatilinea lenta]|uniref:inositol monophosphatase family protein n=1 Tax=Aggregatilinea lenta TaxID=913108 RepID=UPI000E5AC625|nr:inositol monophosphatase family protein [Aggregatilinea lenta]